MNNFIITITDGDEKFPEGSLCRVYDVRTTVLSNDLVYPEEKEINEKYIDEDDEEYIEENRDPPELIQIAETNFLLVSPVDGRFYWYSMDKTKRYSIRVKSCE